MATASPCLMMKSSDLIKKELLDYGGFGEVYVCYHKTLGHVVLKKVYTGPQRTGRQKQSLLDEGSLMSRLNHQRVVKLLGIILEDHDYSLVMELIPKGNLLNMLETVSVPLSLQGRIIVEILEGMVYLTENQVVHKDLKPENILVDRLFHIKIADLGLATNEAWSRLTKEESRRKSLSGKKSCNRAAGTLCYMAPEHLESIHTRSTEKSDVYSFAIVVWVILTHREPFENARSEDQISLCVRQGERPNEEHISSDTPSEIKDLMRTCWHKDPRCRPTFKEAFEKFLPFYQDKLESRIEEDVNNLMRLYDGPEDLVEKLKTLKTSEQNTPEADPLPHSRDFPASLKSSDMGPVEASIEDLSFRSPGESLLEIDAAPPRSPNLQLKLEQEYNYHKYGSRIDELESTSPGAPQQPASSRDVSSVKSWTQPIPYPNQEEEGYLRSAAVGSSFDAFHRPDYTDQISGLYSETDRPRYHHRVPYDRMKSCPESGFPGGEPLRLDSNAALNYSAPLICPPSDSGTGRAVVISNAHAIQIGSNNTMNVRQPENSFNSLSSGFNNRVRYKELLLKFEDHTVTEAHLEIVRENIGSSWKRVARKLGLTEIDVETIEHDYDRDGLAEKVHQMLECWRMREGMLGFTLGKLCRALDGNTKSDVLMHLLDIC